jgi:tetratricopeptide (TPR) repeat protein
VKQTATAPAPIALGPFDLVEPIARGGMGEVWRARHRRDQLPVAVKVITRRRGSIARFRNEVRAAARLSHRNVVLVFDQGLVEGEVSWRAGGRIPVGQPYLAMELASGGTLAGRRFRRWEDLEQVLRDILDGLAHAHARGVLHRDLKPANVLFAATSDQRPGLKLSDFGIARAMRDQPGPDGDGDTAVIGTLRYMAPEQISGRFRDEGPWTDLYALGTMAFQLVSGRTPFGDASGRELAHAQLYVPAPPVRPRLPIPEGFQQWLDRLLAKRPEARFELAADAAAALDALPPPTIVRLRRARGTTAPPPPPESDEPLHLIGAGLGLWGLRPIPMVGRGAERDRLLAALAEVDASGRAHVALLRGGAGTGKSRLAEWLTEHAHETGRATTLRAGHNPISAGSDGLSGLVAAALGSGGLRRAATYARALKLVARHPVAPDDRDEDAELEAAALTEIACSGDDEPGEIDQPRTPRIRFTRPEERYQVVRRLLVRLSHERPVIAWLDDVHFSGDSLRYLLDLAGAEHHPILVIATSRVAVSDAAAELLDELAAADGCTELRIDALGEAARLELVAQLIGLSSDLASEVVERAEGNPLFAVQLVGDWINRGVLVAGDRGFELAAGASREIPDDIHALWSERLGRLARDLAGRSEQRSEQGPARSTNNDRDLAPLELAAALGQRIDFGEWQRACELADLAPAGRLLEQMLTDHFAVDRPGGWEFSHGLVRESLERRAREAGSWADHHRACAAMLAELHSDEPSPQISARIGRHLIAARDLEPAIDHLLDGAEGYRLAGEHALAHTLHDERDAALDDLGVGGEDRRWIIGRIQRAAILQQEGRVSDAIEQLSAAGWAAIEAEHADLVARTETVRGRVHFDMGDPSGARRAYERAIVLFEKTGDRDGLATCLNGLGSMCMWQREIDEAARYVERALELHQQTGDLFELGQTLRVLAHIRHCDRDWTRAAELYQRARSCFDHCGCPLEVANCINDLGELARARGLLDDAEERYREAAHIYATLGAPSLMTAHYNIGLVLLHRGDVDAAERIFSRELADLAGSARSVDRLWLRAGLLACAAANRQWHAWEEHAERVESLLEGSRFVDEDIAALAVVTGKLTAAAGETERARRIYQVARAQLTRMNHADRLADLERAIAALDDPGAIDEP